MRTASSLQLPAPVRSQIFTAARQAMFGDLAKSLTTLEQLRAGSAQLPLLIGPLKAEDVLVQLDGLIRRVKLGVLGLVSSSSLLF
jgi:hypothetical protein